MDIQTNKLTVYGSGDLTTADLLRVWSQTFGTDVAVSLDSLRAWLDANLTANGKTTQYASPNATGFSVTITSANTWLILTPIAGYAAGTIVLPTGVDGREVTVNSTASVAALTISGGTSNGAPTSLAANDFFTLRYDGIMQIWYRVA